jgi:hypothetical protein
LSIPAQAGIIHRLHDQASSLDRNQRLSVIFAQAQLSTALASTSRGRNT